MENKKKKLSVTLHKFPLPAFPSTSTLSLSLQDKLLLQHRVFTPYQRYDRERSLMTSKAK